MPFTTIQQKNRIYQSYLIRCWVFPMEDPAQPPVVRFVMETVSDAPQQWRFNTYEELTTFLQSWLSTNPVKNGDNGR